MKHKYLFAAPAALFLFLTTVSAGQALTPIQQYIAEQAKAGKTVMLNVKLGGRERVAAKVLSAGENGLTVSAQGVTFDLSWRRIIDDDPFFLYESLANYGPMRIRMAILKAGIRNGHAREKSFRDLFNALQSDDPEAAKEIQTLLSPPAKPAMLNTVDVSATAENKAFSESGIFRDRIVGYDCHIDRSAYVAQALGGDAASVSQRFGPDYSFYHKNAKDDAPDIFLRHDGGEYIYKERGKKPIDWTGMGGQCLYVPLTPKESGIDRMMFCWSFHEDHGPAKFWHVYRLRPARSAKEGGEWWAESPDPLLKQPALAKPAQGAARFPVAVARGHVEWSNNGIVAFSNGLIVASGSGNNGDKYPTAQLPPGLVPTAVALTNNNEFALVTAWDIQNCKGKLAVVAMEYQRGYPEKTLVPTWGLPSNGYYSGLKVLGVIDLPFAAPSGVAASCDLSLWKWVLDGPGDLDFSNAANREKWNAATSGSQSAARAGFAVVVSRAENKAAFVDLGPLFQYVRKMYFGSAENAAKTKDCGPAPNQWPIAFDVAPEARPRVVHVIDIAQPSAVATGYTDSNAKGFESRAFIATLGGQLAIYDVGALITPKSPNGVRLITSTPVGRNPTCIALGRSAQDRGTLAVVCRGDREIQFVKVTGNTAKVTRRLRDKRLVDPVWAELSETRGAWVISVADFKGSKVVNYLTAPINSWGDELFGKLGADGKSEFECGGVQPMPGFPFMLSGAEVP